MNPNTFNRRPPYHRKVAYSDDFKSKRLDDRQVQRKTFSSEDAETGYLRLPASALEGGVLSECLPWASKSGEARSCHGCSLDSLVPLQDSASDDPPFWLESLGRSVGDGLSPNSSIFPASKDDPFALNRNNSPRDIGGEVGKLHPFPDSLLSPGGTAKSCASKNQCLTLPEKLMNITNLRSGESPRPVDEPRSLDDSGHGSSRLPPKDSGEGSRFFKTRRCLFHRKGVCVKGDRCTYAHDDLELHPTPDLVKTRLCQDWLNNKCETPNCRFAHGRHELRFTHDFFKTRICHFWQQGGCTKGALCRHAHGQHEIRSLPIKGQESFSLRGGEDFPSRGSTRSTSSPSPNWGSTDPSRMVDSFQGVYNSVHPNDLQANFCNNSLPRQEVGNPDVIEALRLAQEAKRLAEKSEGLLQRSGDIAAARLQDSSAITQRKNTSTEWAYDSNACNHLSPAHPQSNSEIGVEGLAERLLALLLSHPDYFSRCLENMESLSATETDPSVHALKH